MNIVQKHTNLNPRFREPNPQGQFLPHKNVRVVSFGETSLQFVQLGGREPGPVSLLLGGFIPIPHSVLSSTVRVSGGALRGHRTCHWIPYIRFQSRSYQQIGNLVGLYLIFPYNIW